MNKEKQIEEIYRILLDGCNGIDCYECEGNGKKDGCLHYHNANTIYAKGYRKSTDVAEEIFAEIETSLSIADFKGGEVYYAIRAEDYLHYKKKYTEGGE